MKEALRLLLRVLSRRKLATTILLAVMVIATICQGAGYSALLPLLQIVTGDLPSLRTSSGFWTVFRKWLELFPETQWLSVTCLTFAGFAVVSGATKILAQFFSVRFSMSLRGEWMRTLMQRFLEGRYDKAILEKDGGYVNTIINEPSWAAKLVLSALEATLQFLSTLILLMLLFVTNGVAAIISIVIGGTVFVAFHRLCISTVVRTGKERLRLSEQITATTTENLAGLRIIKAFALQQLRLDYFWKKTKKLMRTLVLFTVLRHSYRPILETLAIVCLSAAVVIVSEVTGDKTGSLFSKLSFFSVIVTRILIQASELLGSVTEVINYYPSLRLIEHRLNHEASHEDLDAGKPFIKLQGDIVFQHVVFSYDTCKPLFEDLNIRIRHLKTTALVGPSGGGKSTIVDLLLGLYRPSKGRIVLEPGTDLAEIKLRDWRKRIGLVSQDCFLFNTTVRENLLMARDDATDEDLKNAIIMANALDFLKDSSDAFDINVGERGERLSAGQRQRLTIARAILKDPDMLIFDEATSALDTVSEQMVHKTLENLKGKKTILIIAHRMATTRIADFIYVLDKGRVIEEGAYDELMARGGLFRTLVTAGQP